MKYATKIINYNVCLLIITFSVNTKYTENYISIQLLSSLNMSTQYAYIFLFCVCLLKFSTKSQNKKKMHIFGIF